MRILVVKLGSIGDIIHTLPSLAAIRAALPDAEISWVVEERSAEILRGNPLIDHLVEVDTRSLRSGMSADEILVSIRQQLKGLRQFRFDIAIDFQGLLKSAAIAKLSGAKKRWGFAKDALREPLSRLFLTDAVPVDKTTYIIKKNLTLAQAALGLGPIDEFTFPISVSPEHVTEADSIVELLGGRDFAILNPGGGWMTKLWPAERFGELAGRLLETAGLASVLTTGPGEEILAARAAEHSRTGSMNLATPSLKGFYSLAKRASLYVGGDTGPTHLAVAAGTRIVGLFGPTEWWRNGTPDPNDICVEITGLECRIDCHRRTCSNWICMESTVDSVLDACLRRMNAPEHLITDRVLSTNRVDLVSR